MLLFKRSADGDAAIARYFRQWRKDFTQSQHSHFILMKIGTNMTQYAAETSVLAEIVTLRQALPGWIVSTVELVELAENAERAARAVNPQTADRSSQLIVEVAEWQQKLTDWQKEELSPRLLAELRILKATLDASMDEANAAAAELKLFI